KPFVKSNPSAMSIVTSSKSCSGILDRRRFQHVGDVLALIHRGFEEIVEVFPFDEVARGGAVREELGQRLPGDSITLVLQAVDLVRDVIALVFELTQPRMPGLTFQHPVTQLLE